MRRVVFVTLLGLIAIGCAEVPRCVDCGTPERPRLVIECNAGEVPVCGNDPYNHENGSLLPVSQADDGTCNGIEGSCRPRVLCASAGAAATCPDGTGPGCVPGTETRVNPPRDAGPPRDGGPPPSDAGTDAGAEPDGGTDAGPDAGTDAG